MPQEFHTFHADEQLATLALAEALRKLMPKLSWSAAKRMISQRRVQLNGNLCLDETRRIQSGDVLRISQESLAAPITSKDVRIVYRDQHLVVVDKPAGITTLRHKAEEEWSDNRKQRQPTLDELISELVTPAAPQRAPARRPKQSPSKVRPVHRIDRDTSGLLVFALSPDAEIELIRQFKKHTVERAYIAIALGEVTEQTIESYLVRDRGDGLRGSSADPKAKGAERAVTHVRPLERLTGYTVVECRLETGRTHQIRIHLAEKGHMLAGEKTYIRRPGGKSMEDPSGASRQMLHAAVLGFDHPITQQAVQFVSPLPRDMNRVLERLRKQA